MKFFCAILFNLLTQFCPAQNQNAQSDYFDPALDPIATMVNGRLRLIVSEEVLLRAVAAKFARVGSIEKVDRKQFDKEWYLTLESRHSEDIEQSVFVAIRLKPNSSGDYFADAYWTACTGEGCGSCSYNGKMTGYFCLFDRPGEPGTPGACYQTFSDEPLLSKVPLKSWR